MGDCWGCKYGDVHFTEEPCWTCLGFETDRTAVFSKFEPKEEKENKEMAKQCANCKYLTTPLDREPCSSCKRHEKFEPEEEKENKEMTEQEEVRNCETCLHKDVFVFDEPCASCIRKAPSYPNFVKKENTEMDHAEDKVNHPSHYTTGEIEVINYIRDKLGCEEFTGYCIGNVMKYISRWRHKDGKQDLEKAKVYLQWAIESAEKEGAEV